MVGKHKKILFGCVSENNPHYLTQSLLLLQSLRWFGGKLKGADFLVCIVDDLPVYFSEQFKRYQAKIQKVRRYYPTHSYSNKIQFFLGTTLTRDYDYVVLLDCDTLILQDPSEYIGLAHFSAKFADFATVTPATFETIFSALQLKLPKQTAKTSILGDRSIPYFNSGVLIFSKKGLQSLVPRWVYYNHFLLNHPELLAGCETYTDQASLALAVSHDKKWRALPMTMNFPLHVPQEHMPSSFIHEDAHIIHHHGLIDRQHGHVLSTYFPTIQKRIALFNQALAEERRQQFDNATFWEHRYYQDPELKLGSGIGSRGDPLIYKKKLLDHFFAEEIFKSVADIGCGDCFVTEHIKAPLYTGIDFSENIIQANQKKFPGRTFWIGDFLSLPIRPHEAVICFDVLIHQSSAAVYHQLVKKIIATTIKNGIISGYEQSPHHASEITFFHEPLSITLAKWGAKNIIKMGEYRSTSVFKYYK